MGYKQYQTKRGEQAVKMLVSFIENHYGTLNGTSIHAPNYSTGSHGRPDVVFRKYAIEVKRVELLVKGAFNHGEKYYAHLNNLSIHPDSWDALKEWCSRNKKQPVVVAVITVGRQAPLFIGFSQRQIDELQRAQHHKVWMQLNVWQVFHQGTILKTPNFEMVNQLTRG